MQKSFIDILCILGTVLTPDVLQAQDPAPLQISEKQLLETENKLWLEKMFQDVIEDLSPPKDIYAKYVSPEYTQYVDGKTLTYDDFVAHMKLQKQSLQSVKVVFHQIIAEGNKISTFHTAYAIKKDNQPIEMQVMAIFDLKDKKLISCTELTHLVQGNSSDKDLSSRH